MSEQNPRFAPSNWLEARLARPSPGPWLCTACGVSGPAARVRWGSARIEVGLWILMAGCAAGYVLSAVVDHFFPVFPGAVVRLLALLAKLWLGLGVGYTVYRASSAAAACLSCGQTSLIPLDSPRARQLQRDLGR